MKRKTSITIAVVLIVIIASIFAWAVYTPAVKTGKTEQFNEVKWKIKDGENYPYRNGMLKDLIDNQKLKGLSKEELIAQLGEPDRIDNGHLFYLIAQRRVGFFPVGTKTLVVKLTDDGIVEWRKIHQ